MTYLNGSIERTHTGDVRRALLIVALLLPIQASANTCITRSWTARSFLSTSSVAARAVGVSSDTLRITAPLFGKELHDGDVIHVVPRNCSQVVTGTKYFVAGRCPVGSACQWNFTEVAHANGFEQYAHDRHVVSRPQVLTKLRDWQKKRLSTEELQRWLASADARDAESSDESLTLAVVERVEDLLDFSVEAEACSPSDAAWLREQGAGIFLERLARLPKHETRIAYEAWLDEHEDAQDEWDAGRLESDLELSLESARSWDHSIDCFLRGRREAPQ